MDKEHCTHNIVYFGSGDYYIFCLTCHRKWVNADMEDKADSTGANVGAGSTLSGQQRVRIKVGS